MYQDIWCKGQVLQKGVRECAERYELVRRFCAQYTRPFTVLDIGAADGYFAVRLAEDFSECTVVAVEPRQRIGEVLRANDAKRVLWLQKRMSAADIRGLACVEHFDLTLALSVIHWMKEPPAESLAALRLLGDHLILEVPTEESATGQEVVQALEVPAGAKLLGYGASHLDVSKPRPMYLLSQAKTGLMKGYLGSPRSAHVTITSDFKTKTFAKGKKVHYDFIRGINLQTFLALGGSHPNRAYVAGLLTGAYRRNHPHGDLAAWNVILAGDRAHLIDAKPEAERAEHDAEFLERLLKQVKEHDASTTSGP